MPIGHRVQVAWQRVAPAKAEYYHASYQQSFKKVTYDSERADFEIIKASYDAKEASYKQALTEYRSAQERYRSSIVEYVEKKKAECKVSVWEEVEVEVEVGGDKEECTVYRYKLDRKGRWVLVKQGKTGRKGGKQIRESGWLGYKTWDGV